jgi:hypothetical protein
MAHDLDAPIWDFAVPSGIHRLIRKLRVHTLRQLSERSAADILAIEGCGQTAVRKVEVWLAGHGLGLMETEKEGAE